MTPLTRTRAAAAAGVLSLLLAACSGGSTPAAAPSSAAPSSPAPSSAAVPAAYTPTLVATATVDEIEVFSGPGGSAEQTRVLDRRTETTGTLVFVVEQRRPGWLRVQLPVRPNGLTGWVRESDVTLAENPYAIEIGLSTHELALSKEGQEVLRAPIGVGTTDTPTPGGVYYVKELLQPPTPDGPYGTYAYGLSGFSNVLTSFAGGNGVIGIHGTDAPELVGTDVSSGCIRLTNEVVTMLVEEIGLPLGTPVTITA